MNDHPVHRDDIIALRREGDLSSYMQQLRAAGRDRLDAKPGTTKRKRKPKWGAVPIPADHKPGQWPPGTSPPGPAPERALPAGEWEAATRHLSNLTNRPDQPCDCGNCPASDEEKTT